MIGALLFSLLICATAMGAGLLAGGVYGFGLFCATPFAGGFGSVWWFTRAEMHTSRECTQVALASVLAMGAALLALRVEGLICLLMASPLALLLAWIGGKCAYMFRRRVQWNVAIGLCLILSPGVTLAEFTARPEPPTFEVRSSVDIAAPPETVWRNVVEFSELPAEREWLFHTGVAYPLKATIRGHGPGAIRECVFSTGAFVEPIEIWDAPRLLRFTVTQNPSPMQELSPWPGLHPPHLDGYLVSKRGQFKLTPTPSGGTHFEGTTWYRRHLWPAAYWSLRSDYIIHRIHPRVLDHIQRASEGDTPTRGPA